MNRQGENMNSSKDWRTTQASLSKYSHIIHVFYDFVCVCVCVWAVLIQPWYTGSYSNSPRLYFPEIIVSNRKTQDLRYQDFTYGWKELLRTPCPLLQLLMISWRPWILAEFAHVLYPEAFWKLSFQPVPKVSYCESPHLLRLYLSGTTALPNPATVRTAILVPDCVRQKHHVTFHHQLSEDSVTSSKTTGTAHYI